MKKTSDDLNREVIERNAEFSRRNGSWKPETNLLREGEQAKLDEAEEIRAKAKEWAEYAAQQLRNGTWAG